MRDKHSRFSGTLQIGAFSSQRSHALELLVAQHENKTSNEVVGDYKIDTDLQQRHLRRRTRSHKSFDVPRKLREGGSSWLSQQTNKKNSSRRNNREKKRMSKSGLMKNQSKRWLETHLWCAKRMKMGPGPDGRQVALYPFDKGVRFVIDKAQNGCTVTDLSTTCCLSARVFRNEDLLRYGRLAIVGGGDMMHLEYTSGTRVGNISALHWPDSEHNGRDVGPVSFMWDPIWYTDGDREYRLLYLFSDPRAITELQSLMYTIFSVIENISEKICLFRVRGSKSHQVLSNAFGSCISYSSSDSMIFTEKSKALWNHGILRRGVHLPSSLPQGIGLALPISVASVQCDPATSERSEAEFPNISKELPEEVTCSFNNTFGSALTELCKNSGCNDGYAVVPVLIIHSIYQGWDLLLPSHVSNFVNRLWIRLIHSGATASGFYNEVLAHIASGQRVFPADYPGSKAYESYWCDREMNEANDISRIPASKRSSYPWSLAPPFNALYKNCSEVVIKDLLCVRLSLCHQQPIGAHSKLTDSAQIFIALEEDYKIWKQNRKKGIPMTLSRRPVGFVTSCTGPYRLCPSSIYGSKTSSCAIGTAFCAKSILSLTEMGRLLVRKANSSIRLFVLVKPRMEQGFDSVYSIGYIST